MKLLIKDIDLSLAKEFAIYNQITYSPYTFEKLSIIWFLKRKSIIRKNIGVTEKLYSIDHQFFMNIRDAIYDYNRVKVIDAQEKFKDYYHRKL